MHAFFLTRSWSSNLLHSNCFGWCWLIAENLQMSISPLHTDLSKTGTNVPPVSDVSDTAGGPPSPVVDDSPALLFPSSSQRAMPLAYSLDASPVCQLLHWTAVLFKVCYEKIKSVFLMFSVCSSMHYLCEKYHKPIPARALWPTVSAEDWVLRSVAQSYLTLRDPTDSVAQSCLTPRDPTDCTPQAPLCMGSSRQEGWSGLPGPPPGDLPGPGVKPTSLGPLHCGQVLHPLSHAGSPLVGFLA